LRNMTAPLVLVSLTTIGVFVIYDDNIFIKICGSMLILIAGCITMVMWFNCSETDKFKQLIGRNDKGVDHATNKTVEVS
ncbi:MAG TPA: hypothetical protein VGE40_01845, partial [Bacilli bacterium]